MRLFRRLAAVAPLLLGPACAGGGDDEDDSGVSFGSQGSAAPTMPTMPTAPSSAAGTDDDGNDDDDEPTSGPPPDPTNEPPDPEPVCGNNIVEDGEACDGDNLDDKDCTSFGFDMGTLGCDVACQFDTSLCAIPGCGDGVLMGGEECDCGPTQGACDPVTGLNQYECTDLPSPKGGMYNGGVLTCFSPEACNFDKSGCTYCGDGMIGPAEDCDGGNLNNQTCVSLGFKAGNVACNPDCSINTGACTNVVCGDGECAAPQEDPCTCPEDCPDDQPDSCSPCECGAVSMNCGCDILCLVLEDCCANGPC
jgi:hypothetical protein